MSAELPVFSKEEMAVKESQGFPNAYACLCSIFILNALQSQKQAFEVKELNQMFPVIDRKARASVNLRNYAEFLWVQLDHLGDAGFDPALFRVDCFGNVVYRHADSSSPLAWDIDHWFPLSRGGKTVPSNLRILQWQVCKKKKNELDFLIPMWDLQMGISATQFISIFASKNSDFRRRAFSFFFQDGGKGLECLRKKIPQKYLDSKKKHELAPEPIVSSQNSSEIMVLEAMDLNRPLRQNPLFSASLESIQKEEGAANIELERSRSSISKENYLLGLAPPTIVSSQNSSETMDLEAMDLKLRHSPLFSESIQKEEVAANIELERFRSSISKENYLLGLAPAAIVSSQNSSETMVLESMDIKWRNNPLFSASMESIQKEEGVANIELERFRSSISKENYPLGLAPIAIVSSQNSSETMVLESMDIKWRHNPLFSASMESNQKEDGAANIELERFRSSISKKNYQSDLEDHKNSNCLGISSTRESLRKNKEVSEHHEEITGLVGELNELMKQNVIEQTTLLELEAELRTVRRRVEKFQHLSETRAYDKSLLEKMIRDVMHQAIDCKKNIEENEAASQVLLARLEAQRADCDFSQRKLCEIYKERKELEIHAMVSSEQASKGSKVYDGCHGNNHHLSLKSRVTNPIKKKLQEFLKEEQKTFEEDDISLSFDGKENSKEEFVVITSVITEESNHCQPSKAQKIKDIIPQNSKHEELSISHEFYKRANGKKKQFSDQCCSSYNIEERNGKLLVSKDHDMKFSNKIRESKHCQSNKVHKIEDVIPQKSKFEEFARSRESYKRANGKKKQLSDQCSSSYNVEEGNGKLLVSKDHDLTFNNKLREIHHSKLNIVMPPVEQKKVGNKQNQVQKSVLDGIKTNKSQKQWNLHPSSHEQPEETEEHRYLVGKETAEKRLPTIPENASEGSSCSDFHSTPRNIGEKLNIADEKFNNTNAEIRKFEIELCTTNNGRDNNSSNKVFTEKRFKEKSRAGTSGSSRKVESRGKRRFDVENKEESKIGLPICESSSSRGCKPLLICDCSSSRGCKPLPSLPSMILGLRKSVDFLRRKPMVICDDENAHKKTDFKNTSMISNIISRMSKKEVKK